MKHTPSRLSAFALAAAAVFAPAAGWSATWIGKPMFAAKAANTIVASEQTNQQVAVAPNGYFAVTWTSAGQDGSGLGVYVRAFAADGTPLKPAESRVNVTTAGTQRDPQIAMSATGDFAIVWVSEGQGGDGEAIVTRAFYADGTPKANEQIVNVGSDGVQRNVRVAMAPGGDYAVSWMTDSADGWHADVLVRAFDATGHGKSAVDGAVNSSPASIDGMDELAVDRDGSFVVAWVSGEGGHIAARTVTAEGVPAGAGELAVSGPGAAASQPHVAMDADGDFVVAWVEQGAGQAATRNGGFVPGPRSEIVARLFGADGTPRTSALAVNTHTDGRQEHPQVAMDGHGDFVVSWQSFADRFGPTGTYENIPGIDGVFVRAFKAGGTPVTNTDLQANTTDRSAGARQFVAMSPAGDFTLTWAAGQTFLRTYRATGAPVTTGDVGIGGVGLVASHLGLDANGDAVAVYTAPDNADSLGVFVRKFAGPENVDLRVAAPASADRVAPGGSYSYDVTVTNAHAPGAEVASGMASGVVVTDVLPSGVSFAGFHGAGWTCSAVLPRVTCTYGQLVSAGGAVSLKLDVVAPLLPGALANKVSVSGQQFDRTESATVSDNAASQTTTVDAAVLLDLVPDLFSFTTRAVLPGAVVNSEPVTVRGTNGPARISLGGDPSALLSVNGGAFHRSATGETVRPGDQVVLRMTAPAVRGARSVAGLWIGGVNGQWSLWTSGFDFVDQSGVPANSFATSNPVIVNGLTDAGGPILVATVGSLAIQYQVNNGAFVSLPGLVHNGDTVRVRVLSPAVAGGGTLSTITIGTGVDLWRVITAD